MNSVVCIVINYLFYFIQFKMYAKVHGRDEAKFVLMQPLLIRFQVFNIALRMAETILFT